MRPSTSSIERLVLAAGSGRPSPPFDADDPPVPQQDLVGRQHRDAAHEPDHEVGALVAEGPQAGLAEVAADGVVEQVDAAAARAPWPGP